MITLTESERLRARVVGAADAPTHHLWQPFVCVCGRVHALCGHADTGHEPAKEAAVECRECRRILTADSCAVRPWDVCAPAWGAL